MTKCAFEARIWIDADSIVEIDVWVRELFPANGSGRSGTEWIRESAYEYGHGWWRNHVPEPDRTSDNLQLLVQGTIKGWQSYDGEFDESLDIESIQHLVLPDDWFGSITKEE